MDKSKILLLGKYKPMLFLAYRGPELDDDDEEDGGGDSGTGSSANGNAKPKSPQQKAGEAMIRHVLSEVNGECYSFRYMNFD